MKKQDKYGIVGIETLLRSDPPKEDEKACKCCPDRKGHVHHVILAIKPQPSIYVGLKINSVNDFIHEVISFNRHEWEGKRVQVSVELIPEMYCAHCYSHITRFADDWVNIGICDVCQDYVRCITEDELPVPSTVLVEVSGL